MAENIAEVRLKFRCGGTKVDLCLRHKLALILPWVKQQSLTKFDLCLRHKLALILPWVKQQSLQNSRQNFFWWNQCKTTYKDIFISEISNKIQNWLKYEGSIVYICLLKHPLTPLGPFVRKRIGLSRTIQNQWEPFYCMP